MIIIKIDEQLKKIGKTRHWLSLQTGITYTNISKLANNTTRSIRFDILDKILQTLDCSISDIIEDTTKRNNNNNNHNTL